MTDLAIDLAHVEKTYKGRKGGVRALQGIEMHVRNGEIFGLLGPNGAGKSTLVKILMTVIRPGRCDGMMLGRPVGHKPTLGRIGYLPEHHRFADYLTGSQVLEFYGAMARVPRRERRRRTGELLDVVDMTKWAGTKVKSYSKGMRQRIGIAQALINDPELVVLDEPTDGVDPVGRRDIRNILIDLRSRGKTIFLNSHLLSELEMVCDRVAILVQGKVWTQGTLDDLTRNSRRYEVVIEGSRPSWTGELQPVSFRGVEQALAPGSRASNIPPGRTSTGTSRIILPSDDAAGAQPVIDRLRAEGRTIVSINPIRESLEDLFMRAVQDGAVETGAATGRQVTGRTAPPAVTTAPAKPAPRQEGPA